MSKETIKYPNLEDALKRNRILKKEVAEALGISVIGLSFKLHGRTELKYKEAQAIKKLLDERSGATYNYEYLFKEREA